MKLKETLGLLNMIIGFFGMLFLLFLFKSQITLSVYLLAMFILGIELLKDDKQ